MKIKIILFCLFIFPMTVVSQSKTSNKVYEVKIVGNKIISDESIKDQLRIKKNHRYRKHLVEEDVKNLFNMGYFDNIFVRLQSHKKGFIITYNVKEKSRIDSIEYKGHKVLSLKKLEELSALKKYEFLSIKKLRKGIESIKRGYQEKGYFLVDISYQVKSKKSSDNVQLIIQIKEGKKTLIKRISLIGNHKISDKRIKSVLSNKEKNLLSFLTNRSVYTQEKLKRDQQVIRYLYMEEGYLEMKLSEPEVMLSPDKTGLYISFSISEGEQFKVGKIDYMGDLIFSKVELREGQKLRDGDIFVYSKLQSDLMRVQNKYGDKGYAFANVIPQFQSQDGVIHVLFNIQKGKPVQVRHINISGNQFTRDKVIRRLVTVAEGDLYNASEILKSKNSIQRLGYFENISFLNQPIIGREDQIDLEISLKERENYGMIQVGGGYYSSGGLMLMSKFSKENLMGYGTTVGFQVNMLTAQKQFVLDASYLDPYFLDTDFYFGVNLFSFITGGRVWDTLNVFKSKKSSSSEENDSQQLYKEQLLTGNQEFAKNQWGGNITIGRWLNDTTKLLSKFGFEDVHFLTVSDPQIFVIKEAEGLRNTMSLSLDYDNRDDRLLPKNGIAANLATEYTYQIRERNNKSPIAFTQLDAWMSYYFNLKNILSAFNMIQWDFLEEIVLKNRIQYGRLNTLSQSKVVPFDKLYLLGGPLSLRGFRPLSVGLRKRSETKLADSNEIVETYRPYGGVQQLFYNLELKFPVSLKSKLFGILFFDIGNTADKWEDLLRFRKSAGAGLFWMSPLGPLHIKLGFPFKPVKEYGEKRSEFHFNIGFDF